MAAAAVAAAVAAVAAAAIAGAAAVAAAPAASCEIISGAREFGHGGLAIVLHRIPIRIISSWGSKPRFRHIF